MDAARNLGRQNIAAVTVYAGSGGVVLRRLTDRKAVLGFAEACKDIRPYSPGKESAVVSEYHIVVEGAPGLEVQCYRMTEQPARIVGQIVRTSYSRDSMVHASLGGFESRLLHKWLRDYVESRERDSGAD